MKIDCQVTEIILTNPDDREVAGVSVECSRCGHTTKSFGTTAKSVNRCLFLLRQECPNAEENFYVVTR